MEPEPEVVIRVDNVSKDFVLPHEKVNSLKSLFTGAAKTHGKGKETQHALKDISFDIKKGEFFGIVGRNGSGKSTLLKILAGIYQPNAGKTYTKGKLVPFIELGVGFNAELTGRENVYLNGAMLGFTRQEVDSMYDDIVAFAELERFMDQKLKNYSSGMEVRLAFSMAVRADADILLIDEVLAVGDADFQRKCFNYFRKLKKNKKTIVFVTHDMNAVREYCDRALLIENNKILDIGKPEDIAQEYAQLFLDSDKNSDEDDGETGHNKRWGTGDARFGKVNVKHNDDKIIITTSISSRAAIERMIYGVHIFSTTGSELTATNNRMISAPDISDLVEGDEVSLTWEMLNIFNDGKYFVTLTLVDSVGTVFDWDNEAASFNVKRPQRSTTSIMPPISVETQLVKKTERGDRSHD